MIDKTTHKMALGKDAIRTPGPDSLSGDLSVEQLKRRKSNLLYYNPQSRVELESSACEALVMTVTPLGKLTMIEDMHCINGRI